MLPFTRTDIERLFPAMTWERAEKLFDARSVVEINVERDGRSITGQVRGERRVPFLTRVNIANGRGGRVRLSSTCTCLVYSECEHAAATLLAALDGPPRPRPRRPTSRSTPELEAWIAPGQPGAPAPRWPTGTPTARTACSTSSSRPSGSWRDAASVQPVAVSTITRAPAARRRLRPRAPARDL